ncbi:MAG TPA: hypothetical protein VFJ15_09165 [Oleiagrimonas sp.]|nr:hypothetical protein [Oleiagrimonas sp.]
MSVPAYDASALLAVIFDEPGSDAVMQHSNTSGDESNYLVLGKMRHAPFITAHAAWTWLESFEIVSVRDR